MSTPSEKAIVAATNTLFDMGVKNFGQAEVTYALHAAHEPVLGLDMSVNLREVFEILHDWEHSDPDYVNNDVRSFVIERLGINA